ncbi:MAG: pitrilysin family protein, partial [Pseudomonadota bacterium]
GKEGTVRLMTALMDEGAGELDNVEFQSRLEELGIEFGFSSSRDSFSAGGRMLREDLDAGLELIRLALLSPRFDADPMERMRDRIRTGLIRSETSAGAQAGKALRETLFANHPYENSSSGTLESIDSVNRDDIVAMHKKLVARDTLKVGIVGAISEEGVRKVLDTLFSDIPAKSGIASVPEIEPNLGQNVAIDMPVPNASISLVYKGIKRDDPDFFAAHLMNHVLGGGTFSSRLFKEVREKRGLAYGVSSGLVTLENTAYFSAGTSTRADNRDEAIQVIQTEIKKAAEEGITQAELDKAKRYVAGAYAINNLDTSSKIANVLVSLQTQELGIDYIEKREEYIEAVTLDDVNRMAKKLLSVEPTVVIVGPATQ